MLTIEKKTPNLNLNFFFVLAKALFTGVDHIHRKGSIHGALNPNNIEFHVDSHLIVFKPNQPIDISEFDTNHSPKTLDYISPEQTGRVGHIPDFRSDYYSIGIIFYELLTGQCPFIAVDVMSMVHAHVARKAVPPHQLNQQVPIGLSNLIMKLLSKIPKNRYQSHIAIMKDIDHCQTQWTEKRKINAFKLGSFELPSPLKLNRHLYGREVELIKLSDAIIQCSQEHCKLILIDGESGIGKTALVQEMAKNLPKENALIISGKFDQFTNSSPYSAMSSAIGLTIEEILSRSDTELQKVRQKISEALGEDCRIINEVIPRCELLLGKYPELPDLGPVGTKLRFFNVIQKFLFSLTEPGYPVILFLDDLQWADEASLSLLVNLVTSSQTQRFLIIGTFRTAEVNESHPLNIARTEMELGNADLELIHLEGLDKNKFQQWIADSLDISPEESIGLANMICEQSNGNAFFATKLVIDLQERSMFKFDNVLERWQWQEEDIFEYADSAALPDMMNVSLENLSPVTRELLVLASCLGNEFSVTLLASLKQTEIEAILTLLQPAFDAELIERSNHGTIKKPLVAENKDYFIRFRHDRIREAFYQYENFESRPQMHLHIAEILASTKEASGLNLQLFKVVEQYKRALSLLTDDVDKTKVARLFFLAGEKSDRSTAYAASVDYLTHACELLAVTGWKNSYELTMSIHQHLAEELYLIGDFTKAEEINITALEHARTDLERGQIYERLTVTYTVQAAYDKAIISGRAGLKALGMELAIEDYHSELDLELKRADIALDGRNIVDLCDEKIITDPKHQLTISLLVNIAPAAWLSAPELYAVIVAKSATFSMNYGVTASCATVFATYGCVLATERDMFISAHDFASVGMAIANRFEDLSEQCKSYNMFSAHVNHWVKHIRTTNQICQQGLIAGIKAGELQWVGYLSQWTVVNLICQGAELDLVLTENERLLDINRPSKHEVIIDTLEGIKLLLCELTGKHKNAFENDNRMSLSQQFISRCNQNSSGLSLFNFLVFESQNRIIFNDPESALKSAIAATSQSGFSRGSFTIAEHVFYHALALFALARKAKSENNINQSEYYQSEAVLKVKQMAHWAIDSIENFEPRHLLLRAEQSATENNIDEAIDFYDQAIQTSINTGFKQLTAISCELAGQFWLDRNKKNFADIYLRKAIQFFQQWGATAKVDKLLLDFPHLSSNELERKQPTRVSHSLDLNTTLKASQAIAAELQLDNLITVMLQLAIENAGADRGILLLKEDSVWIAQASANIEGSTRLKDDLKIPDEMINYVARTRESVCLADVKSESNVLSQTFFSSKDICSVLCIPLIRDDKPIAILYLENSLISHAFTEERIKVLNLLLSQMSISLENSILYEKVKQDLAERKLLEKKLLHAHRMETIGTLAGGVAHDFNNLLGIIIGNLDLISRKFDGDDKLQHRLETAKNAAFRGSALTQRMLNFSSQSTEVNKPINIGKLINMFDELICKSLTARVDIDIEIYQADDLWMVELNPNDFEDVLINLTINARDAMPSGGSLIIEVTNTVLDDRFMGYKYKLKPGEYVMITISDTGTGMDKEVAEKIFDPFFTTKVKGEGTGLGLSMAYGFVQRSHGYISVYSEVGVGTTFKIFLPRALDKQCMESPAESKTLLPKGTETVLIVDDEMELAAVAQSILQDMGYTTVCTHSAQEAQQILKNNSNIELVFSDIVMPGGMSGLDLAHVITVQYPSMKILLTSGFTGKMKRYKKDDKLLSNMLMKPYNAIDLANRIRGTLDEVN
ncbi:MAG: putative ATPase/signal transduction histidine kinase/CheY-like chemotaxis protein [Colwellia sp.]|jgi:predicted ATPase/signal transduction histidine kinase/CheY-like chemotaxis protein